MKQYDRRGNIGWLFLLPSLLGIGLFYVIPFIGSLFYTFTEGISDIHFVWFDNFIRLIRNPTFLLAAKNTGVFLLLAVPLVMTIALCIALLVGNGHHAFAHWALLLPMAVPVASFALGWRAIFGETGIANEFLRMIGFPVVDFFDNEHAFFLLLCVYLVKNMGYVSVILTSAIGSLPVEYREAFFLDSNSYRQYVWRILIPQITPMLFFGMVISVMNGFKIFREIYALYGDVPPENIYMLQHFMNNTFRKLNYQRICTAAFLVTTGISIFIWFSLKLQSRVAAQ